MWLIIHSNELWHMETYMTGQAKCSDVCQKCVI